MIPIFRASGVRIPSTGRAIPPKPRKAVGTPFGRTVLNLAVTLVFAAAYFYVVLPPINLKAPEFYVFTLLVCGVYGLCAVLTSGFQGDGAKGYFRFLKKQCLIPLVAGDCCWWSRRWSAARWAGRCSGQAATVIC